MSISFCQHKLEVYIVDKFLLFLHSLKLKTKRLLFCKIAKIDHHDQLDVRCNVVSPGDPTNLHKGTLSTFITNFVQSFLFYYYRGASFQTKTVIISLQACQVTLNFLSLQHEVCRTTTSYCWVTKGVLYPLNRGLTMLLWSHSASLMAHNAS